MQLWLLVPRKAMLDTEYLKKGYLAFHNLEAYLLRPLLRDAVFLDAIPFDALLLSFSMAALSSFSSSSMASPPSSSSF